MPKEKKISRRREIRKAKKKLRKSKTEVKRLSRELVTFDNLLSHNLHEPLRNLELVGSAIMEGEKNLSPLGKQYVVKLRMSAGLIRKLLHDLIEYSHTIVNEKAEFTDLNEILEEVKLELKEDLDVKKAIIVSRGLCSVRVMRNQFRTLFRDLINNALKFAAENVRPKIVIRSRIEAGKEIDAEGISGRKKYCHISFRDNGIGFEPQFREKIFEAFQKLNGDKYPGTGIGLAICRRIAENHDGVMLAESKPGKGAVFHVYVPYRKQKIG